MKKIIGYVTVSGIATICDLILLWTLTSFFGIFYLVSATVSFLVGSLTNFSLNKFFVFKSKNSFSKSYFFFLLFGLAGLIMTLGIMFFLVEFFKINYLISRILAAVVVLSWNFLMNKRFTFS